MLPPAGARLPVVLTGLSGTDLQDGESTRRRVLAGSALFVLGFAVPFTMLGIAFAQLSFLQTSATVRIVMGLVVIALGIVMATGRTGRQWRLASVAPLCAMARTPPG